MKGRSARKRNPWSEFWLGIYPMTRGGLILMLASVILYFWPIGTTGSAASKSPVRDHASALRFLGMGFCVLGRLLHRKQSTDDGAC
jgi:hypothetical protein